MVQHLWGLAGHQYQWRQLAWNGESM